MHDTLTEHTALWVLLLLIFSTNCCQYFCTFTLVNIWILDDDRSCASCQSPSWTKSSHLSALQLIIWQICKLCFFFAPLFSFFLHFLCCTRVFVCSGTKYLCFQKPSYSSVYSRQTTKYKTHHFLCAGNFFPKKELPDSIWKSGIYS